MTGQEAAKQVLDRVYEIIGRNVWIGPYDSLPSTVEQAFTQALSELLPQYEPVRIVNESPKPELEHVAQFEPHTS